MKSINAVLLSVIFLALSLNVHAQVGQRWFQSYNGTGNGQDKAYKIVVDGSGNSYVTGESKGLGINSDYLTIKYNSAGVQQWSNRYDGPGADLDIAHDIAVDAAGNVYITGESRGSSSNLDYATIKYNSAGVQQWASRFNGTGNNADAAFALAVDGSGNVYVTGFSYQSSQDFTTIKYNSSGAQQWVQNYNGPGNGTDIVFAIAIDGSGNVYVTGMSRNTNSNDDYVTIKYNASGVQQWLTRYDNSTYDSPTALKLDASGNVYVTGSTSHGTGFDYATVKYNSSGVQQLMMKYHGPVANTSDVGTAIAVDGSGNIYVTGQSAGPGTGFDITTIKYNSAGASQWIQSYNSPSNYNDYANSMSFDGNYLYIAGASISNSYISNYVTVKYNLSGNQQWVQTYSTSGNNFDYAHSIAVDVNGSVYVTGVVNGAVNSNYGTIKYVQTPAAPVLTSPLNGSNGISLTPLLDWSDVPEAVTYNAQVSTNSNFTTTVLNQTGIAVSQFSVPPGILQNNIIYYWRIAAVNPGGTGGWSAVWNYHTTLVGITLLGTEIPGEFKLYNNYPNPFNPSTKIKFDIPASKVITAGTNASLIVYDLLGREVETLVNEQLQPGTYEVDFNAVSLTSGVYFYKLVTSLFTETKKLILMK